MEMEMAEGRLGRVIALRLKPGTDVLLGLTEACTPKGTYIQSKYNPLGYLLLTPVFFAAIGINVKLDGVSSGMLIFSILLLVISVISKLVGCGLGAKA